MSRKKILIICVIIIIAIVVVVAVLAMTGNLGKNVDKASNSDEKNSGNSAVQIAEQEKEVYNSSVKPFVGESVKGSDVKKMIDNVIVSNNDNVGVKGKFISIEADGITNYDKADELVAACKKAHTNNTEDNIKAAISEITTMRAKINSGKDYEVTAEYESGIIYKVIVGEK